MRICNKQDLEVSDDPLKARSIPSSLYIAHVPQTSYSFPHHLLKETLLLDSVPSIALISDSPYIPDS